MIIMWGGAFLPDLVGPAPQIKVKSRNLVWIIRHSRGRARIQLQERCNVRDLGNSLFISSEVQSNCSNCNLLLMGGGSVVLLDYHYHYRCPRFRTFILSNCALHFVSSHSNTHPPSPTLVSRRADVTFAKNISISSFLS